MSKIEIYNKNIDLVPESACFAQEKIKVLSVANKISNVN